jgi:hypothetical protein
VQAVRIQRRRLELVEQHVSATAATVPAAGIVTAAATTAATTTAVVGPSDERGHVGCVYK